MEDQELQRLVLRLAGPARDRTRLAKLLGITDSSAYGWISLSEQGRFALDTSVRGEQNKAAKQVLLDALDEIDAGRLSFDRVEEFVRDSVTRLMPPAGADVADRIEDDGTLDEYRRSTLKKGLGHAITQLERGLSVDTVIATVETVLAMSKDGP